VLLLSPNFRLDNKLTCPQCGAMLIGRTWLIAGMRNLALCDCACGGRFYVDLPTGQGMLTPIILDADTGQTFDKNGAPWFAQWLRDGFFNRHTAPPSVKEELFRPISRPLLLNCLDVLYGHELMKLFNAQYYLDNHQNHDLVILIHKNFRWLVPQGVAAIWTLDAPMSEGTDWNDGLDVFIKSRLEKNQEIWLAQAVNLPHGDDYHISRFTGVSRFPRGDRQAWLEALQRPRITFVYREDRCWFGENIFYNAIGYAAMRGRRRFPTFGITRFLQQRAISLLAQSLRRISPRIQFNVIGMGPRGGLPSWIDDRRTLQLTADSEVEVCKICANSHVVIGVHGSNMLLPTAHAGAVIDLMPDDRWHNLGQDLALPIGEAREQILRVICLPVKTSCERIATVADSILHYASHVLRLGYSYTRHDATICQNLAALVEEAFTAEENRNNLE
jgi:hypothetical protein